MKFNFKNKKQNSYIFIFVLLVISFLTFTVTIFISKTNVYRLFSKTMLEEERAKLLALSGINLARVQLGMSYLPEEKNEEKSVESAEQKKYKKLLNKILPVINRWQIFKLDENIDGIEGEIRICLVCEDGKINLNKSFDFKANKFKPDVEQVITSMKVSSGTTKIEGDKILKELTDFFKKKNGPIDDLSELLNIKSLEGVNFSYEPSEENISKDLKNSSDENRSICLQDFFTVWSNSEKVEPWLFSSSLCVLFDARLPKFNDAKNMKEKFQKVVDKFKIDLGSNWGINWEIFLPIYEKRSASFEVLKKLLSQQFAPSVYTVISCGKVGNVKRKLLAVLVKQDVDDGNKDSSNQKKRKLNPAEYFKVVKVFWL